MRIVHSAKEKEGQLCEMEIMQVLPSSKGFQAVTNCS